jgi:hypothetical protein
VSRKSAAAAECWTRSARTRERRRGIGAARAHPARSEPCAPASTSRGARPRHHPRHHRLWAQCSADGGVSGWCQESQPMQEGGEERRRGEGARGGARTRLARSLARRLDAWPRLLLGELVGSQWRRDAVAIKATSIALLLHLVLHQPHLPTLVVSGPLLLPVGVRLIGGALPTTLVAHTFLRRHREQRGWWQAGPQWLRAGASCMHCGRFLHAVPKLGID